ncbi:MAG: PSD1 and planctomycete cytochrome C domain-containing protein [Blastocatellia bacterium]
MKRYHHLKLFCFVASLALFGFFNAGRVQSRAQSGDEALAQKAVSILHAHCIQCHGADKASGLDLRTREGLLRGGSRGPAVKPGRHEESLLHRFIEGEEKPRMPLGDELNAVDSEVLNAWIDKGAPWPENRSFSPLAPARAPEKRITDEQRNYWAFRQPVRPAPPAVRQTAWVRNPIDAFILAGLEAKGLAPNPRADKRTLIRRVTFDLTGLPPARAEVDAFLADNAPDAYEKLVRRLLASPRYGERWAQHWLDVVRFGETNGFELDADREQAWRYRDYVVRSLNDDKPYDRFLIEQIAGDEIDPDNFELRVATGFLRAGPQHVVAGNQDVALNRQEWLTEVMFSVGNGVMGLTVGCARCHDHKFDPIPQADFYRLQAFFAAADNYDYKRPTKAEEDAHAEAVKAHRAKLKPILDEIAVIEKPYKERIEAEKRAALEPLYAGALAKEAGQRSEQEKQLAKQAFRMIDVKWEEILAALTPADRERRAALRNKMHTLNLYAPEPLPRALAVADIMTPPPVMRILKGGDVHRPGDEAPPRFPSVTLPPAAPPAAAVEPVQRGEFKSTGRRLALARWLTRPDNPLTARVMMNRLWHYHFGRGIVATPNDFGRNGQQPTHPGLLDWLAAEFAAPSPTGNRPWTLKRMHETILLSNAYQQASTIDDAKARIDPENSLFWRMNRQRVDAEALRDSVLSVAGTLTEQMGGPSIRVPLEPEVVDTVFTESEPDNLWPVHPDPRQHARRSLYLIRKRNVRLPLLVAYDAPDMMSSCGARAVSVHALQSLTLMNSEFMLGQSRALAERLMKEAAGGTDTARITRLYQLAFARKPLPAELRAARQFLRGQTALLRERIARGEPVAALADPARGVDPARAAAWVDLCLATLNLNEFVYLN